MRTLIVFLMIAVITSSQVSAREPMKLNYLKYPPLSWEVNGKVRGIMVDVLNEALQNRMGIKVTHHEYPWKRAQLIVKHGNADGFTTVPTAERREYMDISNEPVIITNITLFAMKGSPKITDLKAVKTIPDLKGFHIIDYTGNGWAKKNLAGLDVTWVPGMDNVLKMLAVGRGDVFVQNSLVTHYNIKMLGLQDKIIEIPNILETVSFNLCVGKKSSYNNILPEFDETIKKMREDGATKKIYDRYK